MVDGSWGMGVYSKLFASGKFVAMACKSLLDKEIASLLGSGHGFDEQVVEKVGVG
jgi:hypothetical protein